VRGKTMGTAINVRKLANAQWEAESRILAETEKVALKRIQQCIEDQQPLPNSVIVLYSEPGIAITPESHPPASWEYHFKVMNDAGAIEFDRVQKQWRPE